MPRFTYRCDEDISRKIKVLKKMTGWSFQRYCDEFFKTLLWKYQSESSMFKDLTTLKQVDYVAGDLFDQPGFKYFIDKQNHA